MAENQSSNTETPENLWSKCPSCDQIIYKKEIEQNFKVCPKCDHNLRMNPQERIELLVDRKPNGDLEFVEFDAELTSGDPLSFSTEATPGNGQTAAKPGSTYLAKLAAERKKTGKAEAATCGIAKIGGNSVVIAAINFEFMGGSMGSVVGEKFTRAMEKALDENIPLIMISASGGARMHEGILSLMQMAKTSAALARLHENSILVISVLCDPTTGGVTASFAMLGDILISEPKALIAFAGPRVIEQTIRQQLPEGFQQAEFLLKHGMIDLIVERKFMRNKLISILNFFDSGKTFLGEAASAAK